MKTEIIMSSALVDDVRLFSKMIGLIASVYGNEDAEVFYNEISSSKDIAVTYIMKDDDVVALGCVSESHFGYGVYELFWDTVAEGERGNGYGKMIVDSSIDWARNHALASSYSEGYAIAITKTRWLSMCGFEVIKNLFNEEKYLSGRVMMFRKL